MSYPGYRGGGRIIDDHVRRFNPTDGIPPPMNVLTAMYEVEKLHQQARRGGTVGTAEYGEACRIVWEYLQRLEIAAARENLDVD